MKRLGYLIILLAATFGVRAQTLAEEYQLIRTSVEKRDHQAAIASLQRLAAKDRAVFELNNFDYLLARMYERSGDVAGASRYYQAVRARDSVLRGYATWRLSQIARFTGNLFLERSLLNELGDASPDSLLSRAARRRRALSFFDSRDLAEVIRTAGQAAGEGMPGPVRREARLLVGRAHLYQGANEPARKIFEDLIATTADATKPDDVALEAVRALDVLDAGGGRYGKQAPKLPEQEHLRRARIYQFNRDFPAARLHYLAVISDHASGGSVPEAIYQIGRGSSLSGDLNDAIQWYERATEQFPEDPIHKDALIQLASAYARFGRHREAIGRYERFIQMYPEDERIDRAYLNIIDVNRDSGEEIEAINQATKVQELFRGKPAESQALFVRARIHMARNDWTNALADLEKLAAMKDLAGMNLPGGTTATEIAFLRAFTLEQLQRFPEAVSAYIAIPHGRNEYYGWLANDRLRQMAGEAASRPFVEEVSRTQQPGETPADARTRLQATLRVTSDQGRRAQLLEELNKAYQAQPGYKAPALPKRNVAGRTQPLETRTAGPARFVAGELIFLGLYDEAASEFEATVRGGPGGGRLSPEQEYSIAYLYLKGDRADRSTAFIERFLKLPADHQPELLPREIAEMLYPAPYAGSLLRHAPQRQVDPRFLLSIMRQESAFRANVKSYAAARGLMQFISDTSLNLAGRLGRTNFEQDELYYPPTAILFGSQYVGDLFAMFPDKPDAVAASYNGGEDNMKRWHARARSELPGRYVPEIAFSQSKDYVWRVMSNYRMYQLLYDENLDLR